MSDSKASVLLLYTGGTIGMIEDSETGTLKPYDFNHLKKHVPELSRLPFHIDSIQFQEPIDSADMDPEQWKKIVWTIEENYSRYSGFVILHGTDTMAYSASALSFMLENLNKPVILTGSQLPIGKMRTDGKENLITALEIAVDQDADGKALVREVCIFFQNLLMRGNRTTKISASYFKAFHSFNFPVLAEAGVEIHYRHDLMYRPPQCGSPKFHTSLDPNVAIVKIFPGIAAEILEAMIGVPRLRGIVLETYGAGNVPCRKWFLEVIERAVNRGLVIVNVTQCASGSVDMKRYESGKAMKDLGVISGRDITAEAAITKLMFLFGKGLDRKEVKRLMKISLAGEASVD